jgi:hypothetical protein
MIVDVAVTSADSSTPAVRTITSNATTAEAFTATSLDSK